MAYRVLVDDNAHYMDLDTRWVRGEYDSIEEALLVCRALVEISLAEHFRAGMSAEELQRAYRADGDDPFIATTDSSLRQVDFSGWDYACQRSREIAAGAT